jgi:crotonobetainyl-CoA:carnitine CoA-transferase CaiB-like acyl-CoA transferase
LSTCSKRWGTRPNSIPQNVLNFRPGPAEKWNLAADDFHQTNPNLIVAQVSAYGQTGPYRKKGGFDRTIGAFAGTTYVTGYPDKPPVRSGYAQIDYMAAYLGAFGVMTALYNRDVNHTGGEVVDLSLAEAAFRSSESALMEYSMTGKIRERTGNRNPPTLFRPILSAILPIWPRTSICGNVRQSWNSTIRKKARSSCRASSRKWSSPPGAQN